MSILAVEMKKLNKPSSYQINLRRLLFFHHESAREAAAVVGVTEQAVSGWLRAKRAQSAEVMLRLAEIYDIDPRTLHMDPLDFAEILGNRSRVAHAETNIAAAKRGQNRTVISRATTRRGTVTKLEPRKKS